MIISVTSLKGGVGKSTIAQNLAVCMAHNGYKVCIADADTNQSSLRWSSLRSDELPIIPAFGTPEKTLSANIKQLALDYEIVIIDGTPTLDKITSKIILLADMLLVPILPSGLDIWATEQFLERYEDAKIEKEKDIPAYMILNQYQSNITFNREVKEALTETSIQLFNSTLRPRTAYREVIIQGKGVFEYKDEKAKYEFLDLYNEVVNVM
ncbi:ParA family protein [Runella slithyformis]|uniref:Cobyrinic acid ac-diamide synthase n=1 Tax=Runella slithyformis (strain ATCC 29530 / DSM 19594 / LMG 11500 / NCIMB 11436 / LSU 4) TaxID=761193 RepID=A0A7U3ZRN3_RUNSL|nr:ParA family protein [Runella slithyformis]AEI52111.1 Cobyrinic acid ac-diamide synthase [Runella slithyformis DSM 19594]